MNKVTLILIAIIIVFLAVLAAYKLKGTGLLSQLRSMTGNYITTTNTTTNTVTYTSPVPSPSGNVDQQLNDLDSSINKAQSADTDTDPTTGL